MTEEGTPPATVLDDSLEGCFKKFITEENKQLPYKNVTKEGFKFEIKRGRDVGLCGYIYLNKNIVEQMDNEIDLLNNWNPHGGVTFSGKLKNNHFEYIYGFDCSHYGDLAGIYEIDENFESWILYSQFINEPSYDNKYKLKDAIRLGYKDMKFVLSEINLWSSKIQEKIFKK
jgi:hypothetical protein